MLVYMPFDIATPPGAGDGVSWATLAWVAHRRGNGDTGHRFDQAVASLDGRIIELSGFMVPFDTEEMHTHFLLSASPRTCFGCWNPGPEGWVEVFAGSPFRDTHDRIVVSGRFSVLRDGPDSLHYLMSDAIRVMGKHG